MRGSVRGFAISCRLILQDKTLLEEEHLGLGGKKEGIGWCLGVPQPGSESSRCNGPVGKSCWLLCPREWEEAGGGTMKLGGPRGYCLVRIWALRKTSGPRGREGGSD